MRLKEWLDANGKKVSTTSGTSSSTTSSGSFKKRLDKLITYYGQHLPAGIDYIDVTLLTPDTLVFTEHYDTGSKAVCRIYIGATTEAWSFRVSVDGKPTDDLSGMGWTELLKTLRAYITVPVTGTPEYKGLLTEWVDSKGKKVSLNNSTSASAVSKTPTKTNKEKFTELLQYIVDHKESYTLKVDISKLDDLGFTYRELREHPPQKYELATIVNYGYGKNNSSWQASIYKSGKNIDVSTGEGWEKLLAFLEDYYNVPKVGTKEYKDLCESTGSIADDFRLYENLWD